MTAELSADGLREVLVGRTITSVEVQGDESTWPQGDGDVILTLDDGNRVELRSWGYDAWGMSWWVRG